MNRLLIYYFLVLLLSFSTAGAQGPVPVTTKVYLDCTVCPENYIKQNINFVSFVRDRQVANIQLLITRQFVAGGGQQVQLRFIALTEEYTLNNRLEAVTYQTDSELSVNR